MPGQLTRIILTPLSLCLILGLVTGCASALQPMDHEPDLRRAPVPDSFLTDQGQVHLAPGSQDSGFQLLDTGRDAFLVRAALIEAASHHIDAQYYIWNDDATGRYLAGRLVAAADRGVQVRLLLDDINAAGKEPLFASLGSHPNIQVRIFNPARSRSGVSRLLALLVDFDRINRRMHNKTLVVDGYVGIAGGRNIGDEYFDEHPTLNFRDRDVMALGPMAGEMTDNFEAYWNSQWAYPLADLYPLPLSEQASDALARLTREPSGTKTFQAAPPQNRQAAETLLSGWFAGMVQAPGELVFDPPPEDPEAPANARQNTAKALYRLVEAAESEVLIESAYLILAEDQLEDLSRVAHPALEIAAITNSLASNDLVTNHSGYARWRTEMLEQAIELYELRPGAPACLKWVASRSACEQGAVSLHSKAVVFDRETLFIGSFNVNLRSMYLNGETVLIIHSPELAETVANDIRYAMAPENSWQVSLDERGDLVWQSSGQRIDHEPGVGFWRRVTSKFLSWWPLEKYL